MVSESIRKAQNNLKLVWESPIRFQKSPRNGLGKLEKQPKWSGREPEPQNQPRTHEWSFPQPFLGALGACLRIGFGSPRPFLGPFGLALKLSRPFLGLVLLFYHVSGLFGAFPGAKRVKTNNFRSILFVKAFGQNFGSKLRDPDPIQLL